jgi:hypothetical protein
MNTEKAVAELHQSWNFEYPGLGFEPGLDRISDDV